MTPSDETAAQQRRTNALYVSAFFDELIACGVQDVVVSPGSRSTALAMVADASEMNLYVDVDERGAAFFALGLAKAKRRPVAVVCTSGTAVGNWLPAVLEAESSRVPLVLLSSDRPPRLQGLGAPQTCDQLKIFGDHVRLFTQMPLPDASDAGIAHARQIARETINAAGAQREDAAPVHVNFPFDEPLLPDLSVPDLFTVGRSKRTIPALIEGERFLSDVDAGLLAQRMHDLRTVVLCGEGTLGDPHDEAQREAVLSWARRYAVPLLADPLSCLRSNNDAQVVENYDNIFGHDDCPEVDLVIRFGRYPISKNTTTALAAARPLQVVVDPHATRDFNSATDVFVRTTPAAFVKGLLRVPDYEPSDRTRENLAAWIDANEREARRIDAVSQADDRFEGAYVNRLLQAAPADSLLWCANSMSVRCVDTFMCKTEKHLTLLANRGLNGIDGTLSSAIGAAQAYEQTTLLTGDLTFLHDVNALALQGELALRAKAGAAHPGIVIVVLDNNGGAIFDMLPQKSEDAYFNRLFLTPQQMNIEQAAAAFSVPYERAEDPAGFTAAYERALGTPGVSIVHVPVPLQGVTDRYRPYK